MADFKAQLAQDVKLVEETLQLYLPEQPDDTVTTAMRYSLLNGGKRLRAALALEFCKLLGGREETALPFACALEMVHAYSLIHDDLPCMDDDDMRRGKPSCHAAFGEAVALLAGDGLLTKAFEVIAQHSVLPAAQTVLTIQMLADAAGHCGMIGGQRLDLENERMQAPIERVEQTNRLKTGALIAAAVKLGCLAADADEQTMQLADVYAQNIGMAFQITDDILDCTSSEEVLGKPIGSDAQNDKTTYVSVYGIDRAWEIAAEKIELAKRSLDRMDCCRTSQDGTFLYDLAEFILSRKN